MALRIGFCLALLLVIVQGQRIAEKKCQEYRKLTVKTASIIPLVVNPNPLRITSFNCSKTVDLIVGGEVARKHEFPHQALLGWSDGDDYKFDCGGSLISKRYVLTAAHCFKQGNPDIVRLGEHNIEDDTDNQVDLPIESIIRHPDHMFKSSYHDIALIKLKDNVRFSKVIRPACLWTGENINVTAVIATGFGSMETAGSGSNLLRKVVLQFVDKQLCERQFSGRRFASGLMDQQLCIGSETSGKDTCQGDSGGPIQTILETKGCTYHVIAVTSLGPLSCGDSPALYTKVSSYIDWIEGIVWKDE
ncbi:serine protease snake-like [Aedes albopictus]|uniref:Peptidase S1 domain-containing protein n=1 Tax=Aedes albopictus TaxID=7160 RepID=A0ABM1XV24_AEDAL|nr:serine protease snake-like [Aedes albopictus]